MMHLTRILAPVLFLAACSGSLEPPDAAVQQQAMAIVEVIETLDIQLFEETFAAGLARPHIRHQTIQHRDQRGMHLQQQTMQVGEDGLQTLLHSRGEVNEDHAEDLAQLPRRIMPEEPAFLGVRFRDEFRFRLLSDTLYWGRPVQVVNVTARPGSNQELKEVRYTVDRATGLLVNYQLTRRNSQVLYGENSRYQLSLRPGPANAWLPHQVSIELLMRLPAARTRMITRQLTFSDYES